VVLEKGADAALSVAVGPDASALDDAIERLGLYAGGSPVETDHVATVVSSIRQNKVFDLTDALGSRNPGRAMALLEEFLGNREEPLRLLALVARHMRQLVLARVYAPQNLPQADLARLLGVPPFAVSKLLSQSRVFNGTQLEVSLMRIARADVELKSSRRPAGLILEDAIMDLCLSD
jgi:DNA polymerase-3 subunit delta